MKYEKTRKEFYEAEIRHMAEQMAGILDSGYSVEVGKSRSGLKIFKLSRKHEVVKRKGNLHE